MFPNAPQWERVKEPLTGYEEYCCSIGPLYFHLSHNLEPEDETPLTRPPRTSRGSFRCRVGTRE